MQKIKGYIVVLNGSELVTYGFFKDTTDLYEPEGEALEIKTFATEAEYLAFLANYETN